MCVCVWFVCVWCERGFGCFVGIEGSMCNGVTINMLIDLCSHSLHIFFTY